VAIGAMPGGALFAHVICMLLVSLLSLLVTAKTATPLSDDSKLTEAQLESHRRATKALEET
jgi:hypothetical protein